MTSGNIEFVNMISISFEPPHHNNRMQPRKRVKLDNEAQSKSNKFEAIYHKIRKANISNEPHALEPLLKSMEVLDRHPILQTPHPHGEVYKQNNDRRKKPIEVYLDAVNSIYKKKDLDILVNPVSYSNVFEEWSPKEIAIFEEGILTFGKQFEIISHIIGTKNHSQVYEFYLEWKGTSHYKSYKANINAGNRNNLEELV